MKSVGDFNDDETYSKSVISHFENMEIIGSPRKIYRIGSNWKYGF